MKTVLKRGFGMLLAVLMVMAIIPQTTITVKASTGVEAFVTRCYKVALDREPEPEGFNYWVSRINGGQAVGFVIAHEFIFSDEYKAKNKSNDEYVKDLYMMFVDREPEQAGYDYWMNKLSSGVSREEVFGGFSNSTEFINLCIGYGITAGYYSNDYDVDRINKVNLFVERLYKTTLGRIGDAEGQAYWVKGLLEKRVSGSECAVNYIESKELQGKGLSNEEYLDVLYAGIMGREADETGRKYWLNSLNNEEKTREQVFEGFSKSAEFNEICNAYDIEAGSYTSPKVLKYVRAYNENNVLTLFGEYNIYGNNKKVTNYDNEGNITNWSENEYDSRQNHIKSTTYDKDGIIIHRDEYEYDANGNTIKNIMFDGKYTWWSEFEYDSEGKQTKYINRDMNGAIINWVEFDYDSNGRRIKGRNYKEPNKLIRWEEYKYDSNGNVIQYINYDKDGNISDRTDYEFDSWGNEISSTQYYSDGHIFKTRFENNYDSNGNLVNSTSYVNDIKCAYNEFDSNGDATFRIIYKSDGSIESTKRFTSEYY